MKHTFKCIPNLESKYDLDLFTFEQGMRNDTCTTSVLADTGSMNELSA